MASKSAFDALMEAKSDYEEDMATNKTKDLTDIAKTAMEFVPGKTLKPVSPALHHPPNTPQLVKAV